MVVWKNIRRDYVNMIIVSGLSGAVKSTVVKKLIEANPDRYELICSVSIRECRTSAECSFFASEEVFARQIA